MTNIQDPQEQDCKIRNTTTDDINLDTITLITKNTSIQKNEWPKF